MARQRSVESKEVESSLVEDLENSLQDFEEGRFEVLDEDKLRD